jgi:hypothetical protein
MARQLRRSTRRVRRYHRYGSKTLYVHGHGELRSNTQPLAFKVPHGVYICICTGPGVAISERLGRKMMRNEPIAINTPLAWMDRPGQPVYLIREQSRTHNMYYPMYCPNYTLLPPDDLQDLSHRSNVFQTDTPISFRDIVYRNKSKFDIIVWTNCTVLRGPNGPLNGPAPMADLTDDL